MMPTRCRKTWIGSALVALLMGLATVAHAADDTARFYGTWKTSFPYNGVTVTLISVHDASGYKNYVVTPTGNQFANEGTFSAANGKWTATADAPNNGGTYHFLDANNISCTNSAGQTVIWRREKSAPVLPGPGANPPASPESIPSPPRRQKAEYQDDPTVSPEINAASKALMAKDYNTAWRTFMAAAQHGESDGEAGVGMMLFNHQNPPGTGYYAQAEKWLLSSANHDNVHGMYFLAQYYNEVGRNLAGGINPGHNNDVSPYERAEAEKKYALARKWFERASDKGDAHAMANLAIMLDAGVGGPRDPQRAAQLRAEASKGLDANYKKRAMGNPTYQAMTMSWQAGHYADAIKIAKEQAAKGDATAEALLGKAYYEGVGVQLNYHTAMDWCKKAAAQNNADGMFIEGLMYEHGAGVTQDTDRAVKIFDRAAELGNRYAQMEAKGMRMQGESNALAARYATACHAAGGYAMDFQCISGGMVIDPYH